MIITSKFSGHCLTCQGAIAAGERVSWTKGIKGVSHAACTEEGAEVQRAVEASRAVDATDVPAPEGLAYLPYQRAGIAFASKRPGTLIGDEMGLGKTIQAIGAINADPTIRAVLVICPASLKLNWARELLKWCVRTPTVAIVNGKAPPAGAIEGLHVVIANYDVLKKHVATLTRAWDLVVIDEAHFIKNGKAQRTKLVHALSQQARRRIALTGTPIPNRPIELWPVLQLVAPEVWDPALPKTDKYPAREKGSGAGFMRFAKRYCNASQGRWGWDFSGHSNLLELQEKLRASCMVRRMKADVLTELPPKRRQVIELPCEGSAVDDECAAWDRHEDQITAMRARVEIASVSEDPEDFASAVAALREATKYAFTEMAAARVATAMAKTDQVIEHVTAALEEGGKLVLFAHHKALIVKLREGLADFSPVVLTGDTAMLDRQAAVDRFQTDPSCRVFIGSITAAGVGLTLTAAAHVVFAELDWTPGNVTQAEDRCHRIGQKASVLVQHLVLEGSLDARMAHVLVEKQRVADEALDKLVVAQIGSVPLVPSTDRPSTEGRRAELDAVAATLTPEQVETIHEALRTLAAYCDGAQVMDGSGFSKIDVAIGHSLAEAPRLTARQAALGQRLVQKYQRQLSEGTVIAAGVTPKAAKAPKARRSRKAESLFD